MLALEEGGEKARNVIAPGHAQRQEMDSPCSLQKECCEPTPRFSLLGSVSNVYSPEDGES